MTCTEGRIALTESCFSELMSQDQNDESKYKVVISGATEIEIIRKLENHGHHNYALLHMIKTERTHSKHSTDTRAV